MDTIFLKLLNMSIAAGWLIIAVTVLRLLIKKAPKWITCALWALVAVRLCCPFALESSFSLIPRAETIPLADDPSSQNPIFYSGVLSYVDRLFTDHSSADNPSADTASANNRSTENTLVDNLYADNNHADNTSSDNFSANGRAAVSARQLHTLLAGARLIWIAGLCIMLCYALISFLRIYHSIQEAVPLQEKIWICDAVRSPFILGLVRPRIYLPSALEQAQFPYVLAHEQAHLKRRDHWWKFLGYMLLAVYWFHPLVWLAYILFCRDLELACDEKVIKDMDLIGKKAYSSALVSCSMPRQMMAVSPLAFGEIGVKERVKTVLNYKKPAFWIVIAAAIACIGVAVCFLTNPRNNAFDIKIVVPAGSLQPFHYSDTEISPTKNQIILSSGDGLGDTEVVLKTIEVTEENAYQPTYMTPGLAVKMNTEKGAWFKIGVAISNPTDEDITVYVHVENVTVRIADADAAGKIQTETSDNEFSTPLTGSANDIHSVLTDAITNAILSQNISSDNSDFDFSCCSFVTLEQLPSIRTITVYGWALYQNYRISENGIEDLGGTHMPVILTFQSSEDKYQLIKYWQPRDGSYYVSDIRAHFPVHIVDDALNSQKYIVQQIQSCYRQAVESNGLDTDSVIENLLDTICSNPKASSNPQDYMNANPIAYRELIYYGEYTLRYCLNRFAAGNETGLEGKIMSMVCETLLQTKGQLPLDADAAATGQLWYDTLLAHGSNKVLPYLNAQNTDNHSAEL